MAAEFRQALSQNFFHTPLRDDQRTGIGDIRSRLAALMHVAIAEHFRSFVAAKRQMKAAIGKNLADDAQVVKHFQAAWLQTLSLASRQNTFPLCR